jgi:hypothetical protein
MSSRSGPQMLTSFLARRASARTLVALAVVGLVFNLGIFPWRTAQLRDLSGVAAPIFDVRFAYPPELVFDVASRLGEHGRLFYGLSEVTVDLVYPLLYSSFFGLLLVRLIPRAIPGRAGLRHLALLPFAALACDYAENVTLAIILLGFPGTMPVAPVASLFTTAKWIFGGTSIALIVLSSLNLLVSRVRACWHAAASWRASRPLRATRP